MNTTDWTPLADRPNVDYYRKQAKALLADANAGSEEALARVKRSHPHPGKLALPLKLADAQVALARENGFESWPKFSGFIEEIRKGDTPLTAFERAADAIVDGDAAELRRLLDKNPALIKARSQRAHHCMLLHYVGSNGFEDYRQKAPKNSLEILDILLAAGAEVDAMADSYGKSTTLGLVATSVHPVVAGVQIELMDRLLEAGADVNGGAGWSIVPACLHNGRGAAAKYLADRGARLNLESAAGVGRADLVQQHLDQGTLLSDKQAVLGFGWACQYGYPDVVLLMLDRGFDIGAPSVAGMTGLHWAAIGAQAEVTRLLLSRGAPLDAVNSYGGTLLGQLLWSAERDGTGLDYRPVVQAYLESGRVSEDTSALAPLRERLGI
jgi:ankyrin repeat protein